MLILIDWSWDRGNKRRGKFRHQYFLVRFRQKTLSVRFRETSVASITNVFTLCCVMLASSDNSLLTSGVTLDMNISVLN